MKKRLVGLGLTQAIIALISVVMILLDSGSLSWAQEYITEEEGTPSSTDEIITPIDRSFEEKPVQEGLFPEAEEQLKDTNPFFRDTKLGLNLRTFYFKREKYDDSKSEAWALGGSLSYRSGWYLDRFGIGAAGYTSQPLYGPDDRDGTGLLKPGQKGYTVLGQLYGRVELFENNFINIYRYEYDTPYINKDDGRMTPNTFEGYTFQGTYGGEKESPRFRYGAGYIDKIKCRNSDRFISMARQAGANVNRGVYVGGGSFSYGGLLIGAIDYYSRDIINIFYGEANYDLKISDRLGVLFGAQFTDQRSTGDELLTGSSFQTDQLGVKTAISLGGGILTLGYTRNSDGANLVHPWSGHPGYTSAQVQNFDRAGEEAFMSKLSYNFTHLGLKDVTGYALFIHGWGMVNPSTGQGLTNENELDFDLQWKPKSGFFKNFWPRLRYAYVKEYEGGRRDIHDFRIIVNYDLQML